MGSRFTSNMPRQHHFDLVVIGAGSAGVRLARLVAQAGKSVAVVESGALGGTCVNVGCIPKKLSVYAARFAHARETSRDYGWDVPEGTLDWNQFRNLRDTEILRLNGIYGNLLQGSGVKVISGHADHCEHRDSRFHTSIYMANGESQSITGDRLALAMGSEPVISTVEGASFLSNSDEVFQLSALPKRIAVWGGGYIATEFSSMFATLGCDVTMIYRAESPLRGFDTDLRTATAENLKGSGVTLKPATSIASVRKTTGEDGVSTIHIDTTEGEAIPCEFALCALGRVPRLDAQPWFSHMLGDKKDQVVNQHTSFEATLKNLYILGDFSHAPQLTPYAIAQAKVAAAHITNCTKPDIDFQTIATGIFTTPEIGTVGLTEEQASERHTTVRVYKTAFRSLHDSFTPKAAKTFMKLICANSDNQVVGVHLIGEAAAELIQLVAVIVSSKLSKSDLDRVIAVHPTIAEELVTFK